MTSGDLLPLHPGQPSRKIDFPIEYNQPDRIASLLKKIVLRQDIGGLLAEGIRPAGEELELEEIAVHVKGLELAAMSTRSI